MEALLEKYVFSDLTHRVFPDVYFVIHMKYAFAVTLLAGVFAFTPGTYAQDEPAIGVYFSKPGVQRIQGESNVFLREVIPGDESSREGIPTNGPANTAQFRVTDFNGSSPTSNIIWNNRWTGSGGSATANGGVYSTTGHSYRRTADSYGGQWNGTGSPTAGTGNEGYLALFNSSGGNPAGVANITFANPLSYFGFFWTAGNASNQIELFGAGDVLLETFDTERLMAIFGANVAPGQPGAKTVRTLGGEEINGIDFYGQPTTGNTSHQPFAFLHFIANGEENAITRIRLSNVETNSAFESDNHTTALWSETGQVYMPTTTNELVIVQPIPEPSTYALLGAAAGIGAWLRRRKR